MTRFEFIDLTFRGRYRDFTLRWIDVAHLAFYAGLWVALYAIFPHHLLDPRTRHGLFLIGTIGLWRYSWWLANLFRSQYYGHVAYPRLRAHADRAWDLGRRPRHVHFMMTTYYENPWTTGKCLEAIVKEVRDEGLHATLWIGTGTAQDEEIITRWMKTAPKTALEVVMVRQNQPGKRAAIGVVLRALSRHGVQENDVAAFLDGDSIIIQGCMQKCLSLFAAFPSLQALTTDEDAICVGPVWMQKWLTMRFAQRRMWMQSHALSHRVLTLTGRFSAFRAPLVIREEFIRLVESDHLNHWFWGSFRFLSGDDKSTWYYLLKERCDMLYVPDALVYTVERIQGDGYRRAFDNVLRWSGNMLRNGMRAILLGPRVVGPFVWWCLVDQRLVIITTLAGFFTMVFVTLFIKPAFFFTYVLWIMLTRFLMSSTLFLYAGRIRMSFPLILYINQLSLAFVKAYLIFRLPQQRWANRNDQRAGFDRANPINRIFPLCQNLFYMALLALVLLLFLGVLQWPDFQQVVPVRKSFFG